MFQENQPLIQIELRYKSRPALEVPEYAELEIHLTNQSEQVQTGLSLELAGAKLRQDISLPVGGSFAWPYNVGDLAGEAVIGLYQSDRATPIAQTAFRVVPQKLSLPELDWIRLERLPTLLARLDAPNRLRLDYKDEPDRRPFEWVSLDFTASRLDYFCRVWLDDGLARQLGNRLDVAGGEQPRREAGFIRGAVRWDATLQNWANQPAETGLVHQWQENPRDYATLPNLLFLYFTQELALEVRRLVSLVHKGGPASPRLKQALPRFQEYARRLESLTPMLLQPVLAVLKSGEFEPRQPRQWLSIEQACRSVRSNPAYRQLADLWLEFVRRYVRLPDDQTSNQWLGSQPTSKLYELWAVCEIASALALSFDGPVGLESALFVGQGMKLYYNQAAPAGWYSHSRKQSVRPDLRLVLPDGQQLLLDVKYRSQASHANGDDMYKMLAYMNDFEVLRGGIIFPGQPAIALSLTEQPTRPAQHLAEFSLRPPAPDGLEEWQQTIITHLKKLAGLD